MDSRITDRRIKIVLKKCKLMNHRSMFVILGSKATDQFPVLYQLLTKGKKKEYSILWCTKTASNVYIDRNESTITVAEKEQRLKLSSGESFKEGVCDGAFLPKPFYCLYKNIETVLYQPFNMVVFENFEEVTPNVLASVIDTVKGGGLLVILLNKIKALEEFSSVYENLDSEMRPSMFNKRFSILLSSCECCLVLDDSLNILTYGPNSFDLQKAMVNKALVNCEEFQEIKSQHQSNIVINALLNLCCTADQAKFLLKILDALKRRTFHATISASSAKGRGKSAVLGLAIAGSLAFNYSNVFISSLSHSNVKILFQFLFKGLDALQYKEDKDYDIIESINPKFDKAIIGINVFRDHPQAVRFIFPGDVEQKLEQAELVVIDEAASIPLPLLKHLIGSHIVVMASTTCGTGATGYSLYENILNSLQQGTTECKKPIGSADLLPTTGSGFENITLKEPIYYSTSDNIEVWLNRLLCFESTIMPDLSFGCPEPQKCRLLYVCQETLFSGQNYSENFLQQLTSLFYCSKRVVSPELLLKMADSNYDIFCLLSQSTNAKRTPEILCAILVHTEKMIPQNIIHCAVSQPGCVSDCFMNWKYTSEESEAFDMVSGIHILDIVTHPYYRRMGYGMRAFKLLQEFYEGKFIALEENPVYFFKDSQNYGKRDSLPPLLLQLTEVQIPKVGCFVVSYNLISDVLRFWKKAGFVPVYITSVVNSAGEHMCYMMKSINKNYETKLLESWHSFRDYYCMLLSSVCRNIPSSFALSLVHSNPEQQAHSKELTKTDIDVYFKPQQMKSLEKYCQNLGDLHSIISCIPILAKLYFKNSFKGISLPIVQEVILLSFGTQHKTVDEISKDINLPSSQIHGLLNRTVRKLTKYLSDIIEKTVAKTILNPEVVMEPISQDLDEELEEAALKIQEQQIEESKKLKDMDFSQYAIKGSEDDWEKALHSGRKTLVSIKSIKKRPEDVEFPKRNQGTSFKAKNKKRR